MIRSGSSIRNRQFRGGPEATGSRGGRYPRAMREIVLTDPLGASSVTIVPARGAIATRFTVGGRELFYLDEDTLRDETKNVRGGSPVLFPSPGPLTADRFTRGGRSGSMKQHGFARQRAWSVVDERPSEATLRLEADEATRAAFPWDHRVELRYALSGAKLTIEQRVTCTDGAPMPFSFGFHPYFAVPDADKAAARIPSGATRAFDNVTKADVEVRGPIDLTAKEVDLHLVDHGAPEATLELPGGRRVIVRASPEYTRWVVWTLAGKDFVCLEPWTAPKDALNTGEGLLTAAPGQTVSLWVSIEGRVNVTARAHSRE